MFDWEQKGTIKNTEEHGSNGSLPRVLILGDSISLGYTPPVVEKLKGKAFVTRPSCNCGPSEFYLRSRGKISDWLGEQPWDVIHVNFGIWDHHFVNDNEEIFFREQHPEIMSLPDIKERLKAIARLGFHTRTSPEDYAKNMREILADLKAHAKYVVFALSTPVPLYDDLYGTAKCIPEYNDIALKACAELSVPVNDLYAVALPLREDQKDGCHFSAYGYNTLADAVVHAVEARL